MGFNEILDNVIKNNIEDQYKDILKFSRKLNFRNNEYLCFLHKLLDLEFILLPGGRFSLGLSEEEEKAANSISSPPPMNVEEMRPVQEVEVRPFLVSRTPFLNIHASKLNDISLNIVYEKDQEYLPFFTDFEKATLISINTGAKIPTEVQWEYFCRANTRTLFCFGNSIPPDEELERWLQWDFKDLHNHNCNDFGIYGLFFGEWCSNTFTSSYDPNAEKINKAKTIRGGGAFFWPWQDDEWVWCTSACRMPSTDLVDGNACFRLLLEV